MEIHEGKYLTFSLGKEEYGIPILKVKEIIGMMEITEVPKSPEFVKGVINLRGKIIPLMDLRLKFGLEEIEYSERTCIIVIDIKNKDNLRQIGVAVDSVSEVVSIQREAIEPPPNYEDGEYEGFLTGIAKVDNKVVMLLNTDKAFKFKGLVKINSLVNPDE
ncbi:chemotaxis protein CheW [Natronospora cellulosivora (SeqCode)]